VAEVDPTDDFSRTDRQLVEIGDVVAMSLPIVVDDRSHERAIAQVLAVARRLGISVDDASCPELAMHLGATLTSARSQAVDGPEVSLNWCSIRGAFTSVEPGPLLLVTSSPSDDRETRARTRMSRMVEYGTDQVRSEQ
jgi:hypothetical protein